MKLARKIILLLLTSFLAVLTALGYFEARIEVADYHARARLELAITGRSLRPVVAEVLAVEGEARALDVILRADADDPNVNLRWVRASDPELDAAARATIERGEELAVVRALPGGERLYMYVPMSGGALALSRSLDTRAVVERVLRERVAIAVVTAFAASVLTVFAGVWLVGRPVHALAAQAERIGHGDLSQRLNLRQKDEIGLLAHEMNKMCDRLIEARRAIDQLRHADRLRTVGTLASGMAHEMGTPLSIVAGRAKMIASDASLPEEARENARIVHGQVDKMTKIIRNLLDFARRESTAKVPGDLREIARRTLDLLAPMAKRSDVMLRLERVESTTSANVNMDAAQIEQALANLVVNSIHATKGGGEIVLDVSTVRARPPADVGGDEAEFVRLSVRDHGEGIAPKHLPRVFEPFFTTKDVGVGTGLGLSVTWGIMRDHGGWVEAESVPLEGSVFSLYFPKGGAS
jgi:two-component system, NtrC family, sensor kinase